MAAYVGADGIVYDYNEYGDVIPVGQASTAAMQAATSENPTASQFSLDNIMKYASQFGTAVLQFSQQSDINKINLERAKRGQPPIDAAAYTGVGVNLGLSPSTQKLIIYGGLATLAFLVFNSLMKRRG